MRVIAALLLFCLLSPAAVLEIASDHKVDYKFYKTSNQDKGTIVVFNGLVYKRQYWNEFIKQINLVGYNVLAFSYSAHPESLRHLDTEAFYMDRSLIWGMPNERGFTQEELADEAKAVMDAANIRGKVIVMSLSYGSFPAVAFATKYHNRVSDLLLTAPAVRPSQAYQPLMNSTGWNNYFQSGEGNPVVDYQYRTWMRSAMYAVMSPNALHVPEGLAFNTYFNGVYHLARAARYEDLRESVKGLNDIKVTLWLAGIEDDGLDDDQQEVWKVLQRNDQIASQKAVFKGARHAMPGAKPFASAIIVPRLLEGFTPDREYIIEETDTHIQFRY